MTIIVQIVLKFVRDKGYEMGEAETADSSTVVAGELSSELTADKSLMEIIRVGLFSNAMLLDCDTNAELVIVFCSTPTHSLLQHITCLLSSELLVSYLFRLISHHW